MRKLTVKQKAILRRYPCASSVDDLPVGIYRELMEINDTEILWQEANRFLSDQYFSRNNPCV